MTQTTETVNVFIPMLPVIGAGSEFAVLGATLAILAASYREYATAQNETSARQSADNIKSLDVAVEMARLRLEDTRLALLDAQGKEPSIYTNSKKRAERSARIEAAEYAETAASVAYDNARHARAWVDFAPGGIPVDPLRTLLDMSMFGQGVKIVVGSKDYDALVMVIRTLTEYTAGMETAKEAA